MAKYRITSIPQSLPKNQFGGLFKNRRKKISGFGFPRRNKSSQDSEYEEEQEVPVQKIKRNSTPPLWEAQTIPVENLLPSSALSAFMPNEPIVEQPDLYNVDPIYNNPKEKTRYSEADRLFNKIVLPEKDDSKSCPQGYVMYKGECLDSRTAFILEGKERDYYYDSRIRELQDIEAKKKADRELRTQEQQRLQKEYIDKVFKSKKSDKIEPITSFTFENFNTLIPILDENKQPIRDEETGELKTQKLLDFVKRDYLVIKNDTDNSVGKKGTYSIFPSDIVLAKIINNGFQPLQFKTLWGFNDDQVKQVEEQFGDIMQISKATYDKTMTEKVLNEMEATGKSAKEIIAGFSKKLGKPTYLEKPIQNYVNAVVENYTKSIQDETNKTEIEKYKGFDFLNATREVWVDKETGKETYKGAENAAFAGETFDPEKYYDYWVNQGKTEKEKTERRKKINDIKNKEYTTQDVWRPGEDKPITVGLNPTVRQATQNVGSDQMLNLREALIEEQNNINLGRFADATGKRIEQKRQSELSQLTGFTNEMSEFLKAYHPEEYKEALNKIYDPKHLNEEDKNKLYSLLSKRDISSINELLMSKQLSEDETYGDLLNNILSGERFAEDFQRWQDIPKISQGTPQKELSTGEKAWDIITNPDEAFMAAGKAFVGNGSFSQNMWDSDNPTMTNNEWQNIAKTDLNVAKYLKDRNFSRGTDFTTLGVLNRFNPFKVIDNASFAYQDNGISGAWDSTLNDVNRAVEVAAFMTPGGALGAGELFAGATKNLGSAYQAYKAAQGLKKIYAASKLAIPALGYGITGINDIVSKVPLVGKPLVRYNLNKLHYGLYPWLAEGLTKELPELIENIGEGEYGDAFGNAGNLALQYTFLKNRLANTPEFFKYTTPSGRTISLGNPNMVGGTFAKNPEQFKEFLLKGNPEFKNEYRSLSQELHPDKAVQTGMSELDAKNRMAMLNGIKKGDYYRTIPFNRNFQMGILPSPSKYDLGKFGNLEIRTSNFKPKTLREIIEFDIPQTPNIVPPRFKKGGISMKLSKKEIDQYIKDGYIIEDE